MQKLSDFIKKWGLELLTLLILCGIFGFLFMEFALNLKPCKLCLWQRIPYYTGFVLSILALFQVPFKRVLIDLLHNLRFSEELFKSFDDKERTLLNVNEHRSQKTFEKDEERMGYAGGLIALIALGFAFSFGISIFQVLLEEGFASFSCIQNEALPKTLLEVKNQINNAVNCSVKQKIFFFRISFLALFYNLFLALFSSLLLLFPRQNLKNR